MPEINETVAEVHKRVGRAAILRYFPQLVHDMMCTCSEAQRENALAALVLADWTLKEAMDAAYDLWMSRG